MEQLLEQAKANVQDKFNEIRAALLMREKLLLRQLEVIANTQRQQETAPLYTESEGDNKECEMCFVTGKEEEELLLSAIRRFGHFQLDSSMQLALHRTQDNRTAGLRNEDYIEPTDDHETMYKCLEETDYKLNDDEAQAESIVVDFSRNKALLEDNAKRSIINITLQEAKDLIRRAKIKRETYVPPLNLEELDDELESSIAEAVSSLGRSCSEQQAPLSNQSKPKARKPRFKPKITINNCNGTINLRNIASLTINCASEEAVSAALPLTTQAPADSSSSPTEQSSITPSSSTYSSNASSRSQSKKQKNNKILEQPVASTSDSQDDACDFYNRLLNEIKKSLKTQPKPEYQEPAATTTTAAEPVSSTAESESILSSQVQPGKRLVLKNFENLKIVLEANSGDEDSFHPVQIEQWLAEIISETDLEPMQNTDILEHSHINNSESN
ncbi:uncharacterized protein LOC108601072 [Drosophila busckii]|uniref:uncharacterized protein LOC108601072 n=1 Tax=Drosophila busckii TaxID=30019 RepID=UPI001432F3FC|nr:uncharacterized protein LOC108601072 [Drosophila busckii]